MNLEEFKAIELKFSQGGDWNLLFTGSLDYFKGKSVYAEESFRLYQHSKDLSLQFFSEQLTPLASGEYLKSYVMYHISKDWYPLETFISRFMGKQHIDEILIAKSMDNELSYEFHENGNIKKEKMSLPPRFHVATGHMSCSLIFCAAKKFDASGGINYQNIIVSENNWKYQGTPKMQYVIMRRPYNKKVDVRVKDKMLKATYFEIYANDNFEKTREVPLKVYLSAHFGIPYLVETPGGQRISIKFLKKADPMEMA